MIELYGGSSPNAIKIVLILEELALPYKILKVNTVSGEQYSDGFLALNPLSKYPVLVDPDGPAQGMAIFESGAILMYLAETYGPHLLPDAGPSRWQSLMWLFAQVAYFGPMLGQHNHFLLHPGEAETYAAHRYAEQARRVYEILDTRLAQQAYLAGDNYSIADIATYPWSEYVIRQGFPPKDFPAIALWRKKLGERAAVQRTEEVWTGLACPNSRMVSLSTEQADIFFGRTSGPRPENDFTALSRKT